MNVKMAATFAAGAACALATVVVLNVATPSARAQETPQTSNATASPGDADLSALVTALHQAGSEIHDSDTRGYYDKLMAAYDIDHWPTSDTPWDASNPAGLLPDINRIQRVAMTLPLQEAGNRIQDKEIAEFYRKFLSDTGLAGPLP